MGIHKGSHMCHYCAYSYHHSESNPAHCVLHERGYPTIGSYCQSWFSLRDAVRRMKREQGEINYPLPEVQDGD